jgi:hypothetical protein
MPHEPLNRTNELTHELGKLIERFGGTRDLEREALCVAQLEAALGETASDGQSLSPLDVLRIRLGKFAATRLPAHVYKNASALAALRGEIHRIARAYAGEAGSQGSRFG